MVKRQSYWSRELYLNKHLMLLELETDWTTNRMVWWVVNVP
jgi:hypothetical protein